VKRRFGFLTALSACHAAPATQAPPQTLHPSMPSRIIAGEATC
jgi:hypothetical protein